ncbi:hypothetical protein BUE80_DR001669 [Diplocarpon rosae]|nr:hypothetical protein BUE80_DR001669 [Diplocarpon rosae]
MYFSIANLIPFAMLLETAFSVFHTEARNPPIICDGIIYNSDAIEACRSLAWYHDFHGSQLGNDYPHLYKNFEEFEFTPGVLPPWKIFPMVTEGFWTLGVDPGPVRCVIGLGGFLAGSIYHIKDSNRFKKCLEVAEDAEVAEVAEAAEVAEDAEDAKDAKDAEVAKVAQVAEVAE